MTTKLRWRRLILLCSLLSHAPVPAQPSSRAFAPAAARAQDREARADQKIGEEASRQIQELAADKRARNAAQKKIDSQLLYALKQRRGQTRAVPTDRIDIELDAEGRALVDISGLVSARLTARVEKLGGEVVSKSERYHTVRALLALEQLEPLARLKDVRHIAPAARATTQGGVTNNRRPEHD